MASAHLRIFGVVAGVVTVFLAVTSVILSFPGDVLGSRNNNSADGIKVVPSTQIHTPFVVPGPPVAKVVPRSLPGQVVEVVRSSRAVKVLLIAAVVLTFVLLACVYFFFYYCKTGTIEFVNPDDVEIGNQPKPQFDDPFDKETEDEDDDEDDVIRKKAKSSRFLKMVLLYLGVAVVATPLIGWVGYRTYVWWESRQAYLKHCAEQFEQKQKAAENNADEFIHPYQQDQQEEQQHEQDDSGLESTAFESALGSFGGGDQLDVAEPNPEVIMERRDDEEEEEIEDEIEVEEQPKYVFEPEFYDLKRKVIPEQLKCDPEPIEINEDYFPNGKHLLGTGNFGSVWVEEDNNMSFARKRIDLGKKNGFTKERALQEYALMLSVQSEHSVKAFNAYVNGVKSVYIDMEYLRGCSLDDHREKLSEAQLARVLSHVIDALNELHSFGFVHRDVKPANIFLVKKSDDGSVERGVLIDYGLACPIGESGSGGAPYFMPPEAFDHPQYCKMRRLKVNRDWPAASNQQKFEEWRKLVQNREPVDVFAVGRVCLWMVQEGRLSVNKPSAEMVDFIKQCTMIHPDDRPTLSSLLDHPFLMKRSD